MHLYGDMEVLSPQTTINLGIIMIGKTFAQYKITEKIGEGGMGVVYKAYDTRLHRAVAVKSLPPGSVISESTQSRFIQEARAASGLDHPNICTIYEINETPDGQSFIAMALYEGGTLKDKLQDGALDQAMAIDISLQAARGFAKAQDHSIIHRDIKPANLFLTTDGIVKILDFGVAKLAGEAHRTSTGSTIGTIAYMSPEQVQGREVDHRTDIWSYGVILYEMLTGELPFQGDYEAAIIYSIIDEIPDNLLDNNPDLNPELVRIVETCLHKNPDQRYQHFDDIIVALERVSGQSGERQYHQPARIPEKSEFNLLKILLPVVIGAVTLLTAVFALNSGNQNTGPPPDTIPIMVTDFENHTGESDLSGISGMFITALEQSEYLSVMTRARMIDLLKQSGYSNVVEINEVLGRQISEGAHIPAMVVANIRKFDEVYTIELNVIDPLEDTFLFTASEKGRGKSSIPTIIDKLARETREGLRHADMDVKESHSNIAQVTTNNIEAYHYFFQGEDHINRLEFHEALDDFRTAVEIDTAFGLAYARMAYAQYWLSPIEGMQEQVLSKALSYIDRIPEKEKLILQSQVAVLNEGYQAGIPIMEKAVHRFPDDKEIVFNAGDYAFHSSQTDLAIKYMERVLELDPTFERAMNHLVWAYRDAGEKEKMLTMARQYVQETGSEQAYMMLIEAHLIAGNIDEAVADSRRLIELNPGNTVAYLIAGDSYFYDYQFEQGLAAYDSALHYARTQMQAAQIYTHLAEAYTFTGQYDKAEKYFLTAMEVGREELKNASEEDLRRGGFRFLLALGKNQALRGNHARALEYFQHAKALYPSSLIIMKEIGAVYVAQAKLDSAKMYADSLQIKEADKREADLKKTFYHSLLGHIALGEERYEDAIRYLSDTWAAQNSLPNILSIDLARAYAGAGRTEEAIGILEEIMSVRRKFGMLDVFSHFTYLLYPHGKYLLATLYEQTEQMQKAVDTYREFLTIWKDADENMMELQEARRRIAILERQMISESNQDSGSVAG